MNRNMDIKKVKGAIPYWAIAEKLGIHENTFYRWMRVEMPEDRKKRALAAIEEVKKELNEGL